MGARTQLQHPRRAGAERDRPSHLKQRRLVSLTINVLGYALDALGQSEHNRRQRSERPDPRVHGKDVQLRQCPPGSAFLWRDGNAQPDGGLLAGTGVAIGAIAVGSAKGVLEYDPSDPKANKASYIAVPALDMATEMVGLDTAQANYQANAAVVKDAMTAYDAVLAIRG